MDNASKLQQSIRPILRLQNENKCITEDLGPLMHIARCHILQTSYTYLSPQELDCLNNLYHTLDDLSKDSAIDRATHAIALRILDQRPTISIELDTTLRFWRFAPPDSYCKIAFERIQNFIHRDDPTNATILDLSDLTDLATASLPLCFFCDPRLNNVYLGPHHVIIPEELIRFKACNTSLIHIIENNRAIAAQDFIENKGNVHTLQGSELLKHPMQLEEQLSVLLLRHWNDAISSPQEPFNPSAFSKVYETLQAFIYFDNRYPPKNMAPFAKALLPIFAQASLPLARDILSRISNDRVAQFVTWSYSQHATLEIVSARHFLARENRCILPTNAENSQILTLLKQKASNIKKLISNITSNFYSIVIQHLFGARVSMHSIADTLQDLPDEIKNSFFKELIQCIFFTNYASSLGEIKRQCDAAEALIPTIYSPYLRQDSYDFLEIKKIYHIISNFLPEALPSLLLNTPYRYYLRMLNKLQEEGVSIEKVISPIRMIPDKNKCAIANVILQGLLEYAMLNSIYNTDLMCYLIELSGMTIFAMENPQENPALQKLLLRVVSYCALLGTNKQAFPLDFDVSCLVTSLPIPFQEQVTPFIQAASWVRSQMLLDPVFAGLPLNEQTILSYQIQELSIAFPSTLEGFILFMPSAIHAFLYSYQLSWQNLINEIYKDCEEKMMEPTALYALQLADVSTGKLPQSLQDLQHLFLCIFQKRDAFFFSPIAENLLGHMENFIFQLQHCSEIDNPYRVFAFLQENQAPSLLSLDKESYFGQTLSIHMQGFQDNIKKQEKTFYFKDLPSSVTFHTPQILINELKSHAERASPEKQFLMLRDVQTIRKSIVKESEYKDLNLMDSITNITLFWHPTTYIYRLMEKTSHPEDSIKDPNLMKLYRIFDFVQSQSNIEKENEGFSPRDHYTLLVFSLLQQCETRQQEGIDAAYGLVPSSDISINTSPAEKYVYQHIKNLLQSTITQLAEALYPGNEQQVHNTFFLKNFLSSSIGLHYPLRFDLHSGCISKDLLEMPKESLLEHFYQIFPSPSALITSLQTAINIDMRSEGSIIYQAVDTELHRSDIWEEQEDLSWGITEMGCCLLLTKFHYLSH